MRSLCLYCMFEIPDSVQRWHSVRLLVASPDTLSIEGEWCSVSLGDWDPRHGSVSRDWQMSEVLRLAYMTRPRLNRIFNMSCRTKSA